MADTDDTLDTAPDLDVDIDPVEVQRKRLRFRSWHRGTREADLLLGPFADKFLADFTPEQLDRYDRLLGVADPDLYNWLSDREAPPDEHDHDVLATLKAFLFREPTPAYPQVQTPPMI